MSLRDECLKVFETGIAVATFAKRIGRDSSTLYKWLDGTREISPVVKEEVREELKKIQAIWIASNFDED